MAKNQKKSTVLSMGGIVHRKQAQQTVPQPTDTTSRQAQKVIANTNLPIASSRVKRPKIHLKGVLKLRFMAIYAVVGAFIASLYLFDINKFPPLLPGGLPQTFNSSGDIDSIAYLPVKITLLGLHKLSFGNEFNARYISVFVMLFSAFCFYKLMSSWVSRRMSAIALLLFACSSWALFQTRQDSVTTMQLALVPAVLYLGSLILYARSKTVRFISSLILVQFIFVPGGIWFILLPALVSVVLSEKTSFKSIIMPSAVFILSVAGYAALIFHWSLTSYHQAIRLLGPELGNLPGFSTMRANLSELPGQLFYSGLNNNTMWLKSTPIIDWVSSVFLIAGLIYLYKSRSRPLKKKIVFLYLILSLLLIILNGAVYISVLLPLIYILIGLGVTYLADQWMVIFPNNPIARGLGLAMISLVILSVCVFHLERYFVGWPATNEYHQIYKN